MSHTIQDQFTSLPVSRQRKYQLRQAAKGLCTECGEPSVTKSSRCLRHLVGSRERQRALKNLKRRYLNSPSYRMEAGLAPLAPVKARAL